MAPAPGGDQIELVFCRFRLIVDELLVHGREIAAGRDRQDAAVLFREARHIFLREVDHKLLGHGVGSDGGEIDHHAALGQSRIERFDHIDRTDRIDFNDIFCCRVAWRNAGGMDDLRHVTERCSITKAFPFNTKHAACKVRKQRVFLLLYAAPVGEDMLLKVPGILTLSAEVRTMIENAVFSQDGGTGRCGI